MIVVLTTMATRKSSSFGSLPSTTRPKTIQRPGSDPSLPFLSSSSSAAENRMKLTKLLLNVTVQRSAGAVQVVMSPESRVRDLVKAAVEAYVKEGRRPLLDKGTGGFDEYQLHYNQFSLECLNPDEKLMNLGSRNFFLCSKEAAAAAAAGANCRRDEEKRPRSGFMDSLLKLRS